MVMGWFIVATDGEGKRGSCRIERRGSRSRSVSVVPIRHFAGIFARRKRSSERENLRETKEARTRLWGRGGRSSKLSHVRYAMQCDVAQLS
jgi:hypothetical protein